MTLVFLLVVHYQFEIKRSTFISQTFWRPFFSHSPKCSPVPKRVLLTNTKSTTAYQNLLLPFFHHSLKISHFHPITFYNCRNWDQLHIKICPAPIYASLLKVLIAAVFLFRSHCYSLWSSICCFQTWSCWAVKGFCSKYDRVLQSWAISLIYIWCRPFSSSNSYRCWCIVFIWLNVIEVELFSIVQPEGSYYSSFWSVRQLLLMSAYDCKLKSEPSSFHDYTEWG